MHVGQPEIAALEAVGQLRVVEAEQVQDGGVEIVDVDSVGGGVDAELNRLAIRRHLRCECRSVWLLADLASFLGRRLRSIRPTARRRSGNLRPAR